MKHYQCGSLVPGCDWHTRDEDEAEIVRRATQHMRQAHNESQIRTDMVDRIKERITEESDAA